MKIWVRQMANGCPSVEVHGEVHSNSSAQLRQTIEKLVDAGQKRVLLRLEGVQAVHDSLVGGIVGALKQMQRNRGHLVILETTPSTEVEDLSQFPNLVDRYTVVRSEEEALQKLAESES